MSNLAVIGIGFGDEGKGSLVNYLCSQFSNSLVIRYCGGHQVGHTVINGEKKHIFSNFSSGTLSGIPTYWSKFCTIDPIGIINELKSLENIGITPKLYIDEDCPITTPYDKFYNQQTELENKHGSCGVGFAATIEREENHYSLTFNDLFYPEIVRIKLQMIKEYYEQKLNEIDKQINIHRLLHSSIHTDFPDMRKLNFKLINEVEDFVNACNQLLQLKFVEKGKLDRIFCQNYIFESSQGLLLDQNFGFFPHVTRSNIGSKNIIKLIKPINTRYPLNCSNNIEYYLVTRAYQTRHGNGPMTNESYGHNIKENPEESNVSGQWQGEFRRSLLDLDLIEYAIKKDKNIQESSKKTLVITCLDHVVDEYRFTYKGELIYSKNEREFIKKISNILNIRNILTNNSPDSKTFKKFNK